MIYSRVSLKGESEKILGIDPGLSVTGWAVVRYRGANNFEYEDHGSIPTCTNDPLHKRLGKIHQEIAKVLKKYDPSSVAIENFFVGINRSTTIQTLHARGVILLAFSSFNPVSVGEYAPNSVKKCLTGEGHATKEQVESSVRRYLNLNDKGSLKLNSHESDALALAICYARKALSGESEAKTIKHSTMRYNKT